MGCYLAEFRLQPKDVGCLLGWQVAEQIELEFIFFSDGSGLVLLVYGFGGQKLRFV